MRMYAVHGQGGGSTWASPLNQLEKMMRAFNVHVYFTGHHHKSLAAAATKLDADVNHPTQLRATDARIFAGGSWLRGYLPNETTYAEDGLMVPLAVGAPVLRVRRKNDGTFRLRVEV